MKNNDFKKVRITNCMCFYFDDIIELEDFGLDNILIDKKSHRNVLIYNISYKTLIDPKPLRTRFDQIDEFIRIYDGIRYLKLLGSEKYDAVYDRIRYLISVKSDSIFFLTFLQKSKSYASLPTGKLLTSHNVIIRI